MAKAETHNHTKVSRCGGTFTLHGTGTRSETRKIGYYILCRTVHTAPGPGMVPDQFGFFTIRISVRLSDRFKVTQHKINFVKNCPEWGLNSQSLDHQSGALTTELARNLLEISEVSFLLFHAPLHMLDFVYF